MKIFDKDYRINFVDDNNVFVGWCNSSCCCENFGWYFEDKNANKILEDNYDSSILEGFNFDKDFYEFIEEGGDAGGKVKFRLTKENEEIYLLLYNYHNGYYGHGFSFTDENEKIIKDDVL